MASPVHPHQTCDGNWVWHRDAQRLTLDVEPGTPLADLRGSWSLDGLAAILDGLSASRLHESFETSDQIGVACDLMLPDGRSLHLLGAFTEPAEARGLVFLDRFMGEDAAELRDVPGPRLSPVYQPILSLHTGLTVGFEAFARWEAEGGGTASPHRFQDDGLASNMLLQAVDALAEWRRRADRPDVFVQVNLSGRDLEIEGLADLVAALVQGHGLPPGALKLELTEQAPLRDAAAALEAARRLKAAGAGLVLDDFGTGHSSFAWLADLPADSVKIDPTLTRDLDDPRRRAILESVAALARTLGLTSTAEGVESLEAARTLQAIGFDQVQGFAFARPMGRGDALDFLRRDRRHV